MALSQENSFLYLDRGHLQPDYSERRNKITIKWWDFGVPEHAGEKFRLYLKFFLEDIEKFKQEVTLIELPL